MIQGKQNVIGEGRNHISTFAFQVGAYKNYL